LSIDSSNTDILRAGLGACDRARPAPMLNSVSLERIVALDLMTEFNAAAIVSAAGESDLPCTTEGRLANIDRITAKLRAARVTDERIHFDPLVFPMSTDPSNGKLFLEAVSAIRKTYGAKVHMAAGLSNISFGMPNRKLLNQVFAFLSVEAGGDGGIVDPLQINKDILNSLDVKSEPFKLARAALLGEDEFGMNYITACREGAI
jgi:5-methyltetrahydrofolate--homocysteine methyltransferase